MTKDPWSDRKSKTGRGNISKPSRGRCKNCGNDDLVFHDDGTGSCPYCRRTFRWDSSTPGPAGRKTRDYGRYDHYSPPPPGQGSYSSPYPADQSYTHGGYEPPRAGECKDCGDTDLEFHPSGSGSCRNCGHTFYWLNAQSGGTAARERDLQWGLYRSRTDIKYALDTGTSPGFIINALVHQGMDKSTATSMLDDIVAELEHEKSSRQHYIDSMINDFNDEENFSFRTARQPPAEPRHEPDDDYTVFRPAGSADEVELEPDEEEDGYGYDDDGDDNSDADAYDDDDETEDEDDEDEEDDENDAGGIDWFDADESNADDLKITLPGDLVSDEPDGDDDDLNWLDLKPKGVKKTNKR